MHHTSCFSYTQLQFIHQQSIKHLYTLTLDYDSSIYTVQLCSQLASFWGHSLQNPSCFRFATGFSSYLSETLTFTPGKHSEDIEVTIQLAMYNFILMDNLTTVTFMHGCANSQLNYISEKSHTARLCKLVSKVYTKMVSYKNCD